MSGGVETREALASVIKRAAQLGPFGPNTVSLIVNGDPVRLNGREAEEVADAIIESPWLAARDAEKDAELETMQMSIDAAMMTVRQYAAQVGAIAALVDEWADDMNLHAASPADMLDDLQRILADSAGAIAKHEQEVRGEALRDAADWLAEGVVAQIDDDMRLRPDILLDLLRARADALTEGRAGE